MRTRLVLFSCVSFAACTALAGCGSATSKQAPAGEDAGGPVVHDGGTWRPDLAHPTVSPASHPSAHADAGRHVPSSVVVMADASSDAGESTGPVCVPEGGVDLPDDDFVDSNCDGIDGDAAEAVFVAPAGSDAAPGTKAAPVQTLKRAIDLATSAGKSVYVCNGEYDEAVDFEKTGVSLYGGYDCTRDWERVRDRATVSPKLGVPFTANGLTNAIVVERLAFKAGDATGVARTSIAASVVDSVQVAFRGALFIAGNGTDGAAGVAGEPIENGQGPIPQYPGFPAIALVLSGQCSLGNQISGDPKCNLAPPGGLGPALPCPDGTQVLGGQGGDGINLGLPDTHLGQDGTPSSGVNLDGATGENGVPGLPSARGFGALAGSTYVASNDGQDGNWGRSGQSGKGGDGGDARLGSSDVVKNYIPGGGGGQGGYGGCGGMGGTHGHGGGASLGLVIVKSTVSIDESTIQTGHGGNGGAGGEGSSGQVGGQPGPGASGPGFPGKPGGKGGDGGRGGAGGPGGGGPSIGIVWTEDAPSLKHVTFAIGTAGHGGTSSDLNASDGISGDSLSLTEITAMGSAGND